MLTTEQYEFLSAPYPTEDIEFIRGFAYVRERAINRRLSAVDPSWDYRIVSYEYRSPTHVVCMVEIKFAEIVRGGIGEQKNEGNNAKELDCAKGAETDAFKRAARKFGVGLYLTELPDNVKDYNSYDTWYRQETGQAPKQPTGRATSPASASNGNGASNHSQTSKNAQNGVKSENGSKSQKGAEEFPNPLLVNSIFYNKGTGGNYMVFRGKDNPRQTASSYGGREKLIEAMSFVWNDDVLNGIQKWESGNVYPIPDTLVKWEQKDDHKIVVSLTMAVPA